jgi:aldehyde:ferredoxin oxidoreductase
LYNSVGVLPSRNFQRQVVEETSKISGEAVAEQFLIRNRGCFSCPLACGGPAQVNKAPFQGKGERPEYETHFAAATCSVYDPAALLKFNSICNELGIDTIDAGCSIACAMELSEKGYLPEEDVGFKLNFGDGEAMVKLTEQIAYRQGFGEVMAEGGCVLAEKYGHPELFIHVKKMACTAYDVRNVKGMALNLATSVRGACHNRGYTPAPEILGMPEKVDPLTIENKASLVKNLQDMTAGIIDAAGICLFSIVGQSPHSMFAQLEAVTGVGYTFEEVVQAGERIWNLQRLFNLKAGLSKNDDTIPKRFLEEPAAGGPNKGNVLSAQELETMLKEYYELRGWDRETGYPTKEKLTELGLEEYISLLPD